MNKNISKLAFPLFIVWPLGGFLLALTNLRKRTSAIVYVLFSALFAYSFHFKFLSADSSRLAIQFINYSKTSNIFETILLFNSGNITDLYLPFSFVFVKQFSNNPKVLFAIFGFIYGVLSYKSLKLLLENKKYTITWQIFIITLIFISFYPLSAVNGVRFNTAALLLFCSIINIFIYNKSIWILGLFLTLLIHFSYIVVIPVILFLWFCRKYFNKKQKDFNWVYWLFTISLILSLIIPANFFAVDFLLNLGIFSDSVKWKLDAYTSDNATSLYNERLETSLFLNVSKYFGNVIKLVLLILVFMIKRKASRFAILGEFKGFYYILLLYLSFGFIAASVPSGGRFLIIGYMLFFYFFYQVYYTSNGKIISDSYILLLLPVFAFDVIFKIGYLSIALTDSSIWYGNIFLIIYKGVNYSPMLY